MPHATPSKLSCLRCGGVLELGYVIEKTSSYGDTESWVEGEPESNWLGKKLDGRRVLPVTSHRCVECGQLAFFAMEDRE
jgi:hypothetical protein